MNVANLLRCAAVAVPGLVSAACAGAGGLTPALDGVETRIVGVDLEGIDLAFDVGIANPLPVAIPAPTFEYRLDVQGAPLASGKDVKASEIPAARRGQATVPVRVGYSDLAKVLKGLDGVDEASYAVSGTVRLPALGQSFRVPFEKQGTFPVVRAPSVEFRSLDTSKLTVGGGSVAVDADLENPNAFAVGLDDLGWSLELGGSRIGGLRAATQGTVGPRERRSLRLEADVSGIDVVKSLLGAKGGKFRIVPKGAFTTPYGEIRLK